MRRKIIKAKHQIIKISFREPAKFIMSLQRPLTEGRFLETATGRGTGNEVSFVRHQLYALCEYIRGGTRADDTTLPAVVDRRRG